MADLKQLEILKQGVDAWNRHVQASDKIDLSREHPVTAIWSVVGAMGSAPKSAGLPKEDLREAFLHAACSKMRHLCCFKEFVFSRPVT